jgi:hypothetical protein
MLFLLRGRSEKWPRPNVMPGVLLAALVAAPLLGAW